MSKLLEDESMFNNELLFAQSQATQWDISTLKVFFFFPVLDTNGLTLYAVFHLTDNIQPTEQLHKITF